MSQLSKKALVLGVLVLAAIVAVIKLVMPSEKNKDMMPADTGNNTEPKPMTETTATAPTVPAAKEVTFKTSYTSPAGKDDVGFTLSVDALGTIVGAKTDVLTTHPISMKRQQAFADGLLPVVKGKKLSELTSIDKVGGSSLTTKAFNDSLDELKAQL